MVSFFFLVSEKFSHMPEMERSFSTQNSGKTNSKLTVFHEEFLISETSQHDPMGTVSFCIQVSRWDISKLTNVTNE